MAKKSEINNKKTKTSAKAKTSAPVKTVAKKNASVKGKLTAKASASAKKTITKTLAKSASKKVPVKKNGKSVSKAPAKTVAVSLKKSKPVISKGINGSSKKSVPVSKNIKPAKEIAKSAPVKQAVKEVKPPVKKEQVKQQPKPEVKAQGKKGSKGKEPVKSVPQMKVQMPDRKVVASVPSNYDAPVEILGNQKTLGAKGKRFEIEYTVRASTRLLFEFLTSPSGLSEWFADDVNITRDGLYTFFWEGTEQKAQLISKKENQLVKYKWLDEPKDTYFEFRIEVDDLTSDVALIITDFAEDAEAMAASRLLWDAQIGNLLHAIGSY